MIDGGENSPTSSYSSSLKYEINRLTKMVYGEEQQKNFDHPGKYTAQSSSQEDSSTRNEEPPTTDVHVPSDSDDSSDTELQETVGPLGILGWEQIQQLANALFDLRDCTALTEAQVIHLIRV